MTTKLTITGQVVEVGSSGDGNVNIVVIDRTGERDTISIEGLTDDEARFFGRNFFTQVVVTVEGAQ